MDVKAAFCSALQKNPALRTEEFSTWPRLFEFLATPGSGGEVLVKPDGFIRIREEEGSEVFEQTFFLELDRSTETLDTLGRRALCYLDFYQRGGLAERFGRPRSEYKDFPFRVLMIFKTEERRNNMAERLLTQTPPILTQVWLSTLKEVTTSPLGQIWIRPRDYREATEGTAYAVGGRAFPSTYRRQLAREVLVEAAVKKHELFRKDS
jgi:hypothetical protein